MKLQTTASKFKSALSIVKPSVASSNIDIPVLKSVKLECYNEDSTVKLTTYNGSYGIITKLTCDYSEEFEPLCLDFTTLYGIASVLEGDITISLKDEQLIIKHASGKFKVNTFNADEYPDLPVCDAEVNQVEWTTIKPLLASIVSVASTDLNKQILTGVNFNESNITATDSYRLATVDSGITAFDSNVTVVESIIQSALSAFPNSVKEVSFSKKDNLVEFSSSDTTLIGFSIAGDYPKYEQLIPTKYPCILSVDATKFKKAIKVIAPLVDTANNLISIEFKENTITLFNDRAGVGSGSVVVECESHALVDESIKASFNYKYLCEAVKYFTKDVTINFSTPQHPFVFKQDDYLHLIMPVQSR